MNTVETKYFAVALFYLDTSMISATMANSSTTHVNIECNGVDANHALGFALNELKNKKQGGKFLYSWSVVELLHKEQGVKVSDTTTAKSMDEPLLPNKKS